MKINSPLPAQNSINKARQALEKHLERLATGKKLNRSADNPAAMAIYEQLQAEAASMEQASRNIGDGSSLANLADGAMEQQQNILGRMRELAVQGANGTLDNTARGAIQTEYAGLQDELDRTSRVTEYNGNQVLQGGTASIQVSAQANDTIDVTTVDSSAAGLGVTGSNLGTQADAQTAIDTLDQAISTLGSARATVGATSNRLGFAEAVNRRAYENVVDAASRMGDADIAEEVSKVQRESLLLQAALKAREEATDSQGLLLNLIG